ncbi:MFS transporter [Reichenbachiella sp. 5M10]|nr:MFS transporter [Reichenbachiella sp. 5M10]
MGTIVVAQFLCTSIWFAGNAVIDQWVSCFGFSDQALSQLTSGVQFGFIMGTLSYALLNLTDKYSPSRVFFISAVLAALCNISLIVLPPTLGGFTLLRFGVGFFLAGIYPVGMKIAADYFKTGLGQSLGFLVGALVIGTALPHLLRGAWLALPWQAVIGTTSGLCLFGGLWIGLAVPDGPYRTGVQKIILSKTFEIFRDKQFRTAAIGYFGHMWELYTFWALVPAMLHWYQNLHSETTLPMNLPLLSFGIIAVGAVACFVAGKLSNRIPSETIAYVSLFGSALCCLLSPLLFDVDSFGLFYSYLLIWGMLVIADSPMFSTLVAQNAPTHLKGSALTIVNCIGFSLTIVSIQVMSHLNHVLTLPILAIGPVLGLAIHLRSKSPSRR